MLRKIAPLLTLVLCTFGSMTSAQEFDNFRFVGEEAPASAGFVTSVSLGSDTSAATLSFLNAAGLSTVYNISLQHSDIIRSSTTVFLPPAGFAEDSSQPMGLADMQFLTGTLTDPQGGNAPAHWFRLTLYNNRWSGVFRVADRIYSINRQADNTVIDFRHTSSQYDKFQPSRRLKISAVIDEQYLLASAPDQPGHLNALESIHVMDGLLADTLGTTVLLENIIYQSAAALSTESNDLLEGAQKWLGTESQVFGLTDNYATLFFREAANRNAITSGSNQKNGIADNGIIVQGTNPEHQFATAHYFGSLLGLSNQPQTLQHWMSSGDIALPVVYWTAQQKETVDLNPPPTELTQILIYDAPDTSPPSLDEVNVVARQLVDADSHEGSPTGAPLLSDGSSNPADSGGGVLRPDFFLLLIAFGSHIRTRKIPATQAR